jgi:hypothetical protein
MGFEGWYLMLHFSKRKALSVGFLMVILSVTLISASPTLAYFHIADRESNTIGAENSLVQVFLPRPMNVGNFSDLNETSGVKEVIPVASDTVTISAGGKDASDVVYFVSSSDESKVFTLFDFGSTNALPTQNWLYFGYVEGSNQGIPVGRLTKVDVRSIGEMTATSARTTYSDSDFNVFGDIQAYWASAQTASSVTYNLLFVIAMNSSAADGVAARIASEHPLWQVESPTQNAGARATVASGQLLFTASLSAVSWAFGLFVFVTYVVREVSSRSKELVILGALGASRATLTRCVSYYLLILTSVGSIVGLVLTLYVLDPVVEMQSFGYPLIESLSTISKTVLVVLAPVLVLDVAIVVALQIRLSRLDMMSFLRSEV